LAVVQNADSGKWAFIDRSGKEVTPFIYDSNSEFSEGIAFVTVDSKNFFIDRTGTVIKQVDYRNVGEFVDGITYVTKGEHHFSKSFYIDKDGNEYF
jgi:hypothetical protein